MRRALALAAAAALLAPAAATAQEPPPAPPAPPPAAQIAIAVEKQLRAEGRKFVLRGHALQVRGTMTPAVPRQRVRLTVRHEGKVVRTLRVRVRADGSFSRRVPAWRAGLMSVRALHRATPELGRAQGPKVFVRVVAPRASTGMRGPLVRLLQRGLRKLHYAVPLHGSYDLATARAVMAFRKVNRMSWRYDAGRRVIERVLAGQGAFKPRYPEAGHHVEADISRQVLALIDGGEVVATYHTSSGAPATPTIIGTFRVYMQTPGTNAKGMVHSSYFIRGYAIHGYYDVPAFNASHGCLRVPIPDAWRIFRWLRIGDRVITYR